MMTIRVSTGQNELDVCLQALIFAYNTSAISMRTKWFSIDNDTHVLFKNLDFGMNVLARVRSILERGYYLDATSGFVDANARFSVDLPAGFGKWAGVFGVKDVVLLSLI